MHRHFTCLAISQFSHTLLLALSTLKSVTKKKTTKQNGCANLEAHRHSACLLFSYFIVFFLALLVLLRMLRLDGVIVCFVRKTKLKHQGNDGARNTNLVHCYNFAYARCDKHGTFTVSQSELATPGENMKRVNGRDEEHRGSS